MPGLVKVVNVTPCVTTAGGSGDGDDGGSGSNGQEQYDVNSVVFITARLSDRFQGRLDVSIYIFVMINYYKYMI